MLNQAIWNEDTKWNKLDFFASFNVIRKQTFIKFNIQSAFKNPELSSFNSNIVIDKILAMQSSERLTISSKLFNQKSIDWLFF